MWICASEKIAIFLQDERSIEFGGAGDDEFRGRSSRVQQRARGANSSKRLARATMRAENIVGGNASATETAVDRLHLRGLATNNCGRQPVTDPPRHQLLEMISEFVSQLARRAKAIFRFVLDRAHQDLFYL